MRLQRETENVRLQRETERGAAERDRERGAAERNRERGEAEFKKTSSYDIKLLKQYKCTHLHTCQEIHAVAWKAVAWR